MQPTEEQERAVKTFGLGKSAKINAFAGTGKTKTLQLIASSTCKEGIYLAFNRATAREAQEKFPGNVLPYTTHSYALRALGSFLETTGKSIDRSHNGNMIAEILELSDFEVESKLTFSARHLGSLVSKTVTHFCHSGDSEISARHVVPPSRLTQCDPDTIGAFKDLVAELADKLWTKISSPDHRFNILHDHYLKMWSLSDPVIAADFVLLDEAQDTNAAVLNVLKSQSCQIIFVGDRHQQIYEWRGALNAMEKIPVDHETSLTRSFRFGPRIADVANHILRMLNEPLVLTGGAPDPGRVDIDIDGNKANTVLCRTNVGVVETILSGLNMGRRPFVATGVGPLERLLKDVVRLKNGVAGESEEFFGFSHWAEVEDFARSGEDDSLQRIVNLVDKFGEQKLLDMLPRIKLQENQSDFTVSTVHQAKGLEWEDVRIHDDFYRRSVKGMPELRSGDEETRLLYVAATRAKKSLHISPELAMALTLDPPSCRPDRDASRISPSRTQIPPQGSSAFGEQLLGVLGRSSASAVRIERRIHEPKAPTRSAAKTELPAITRTRAADPDEDLYAPARSIGTRWGSRTGSGLENVWVNACVLAAEPSGDNIVLRFIDTRGNERSLRDFGRQGLRIAVLEYLRKDLPCRKTFLVTYPPSNLSSARLASDTMMLPQYRRDWG